MLILAPNSKPYFQMNFTKSILPTSKSLLHLVVFAAFVSCNSPQLKNNAKSNIVKPFTLSLPQLEAQNKITPKKSIIFLYDPMCEDCTKVRMYALENSQIEQYMQQHFYTADLSIYEENDIQFNNKTWVYKQDIVGRPYHELAQALNQAESISTPCLTFLDENLNIIIPIKKAVTAQELELLLVFVATDSFKQMSVDQFQQQYKIASFNFP